MKKKVNKMIYCMDCNLFATKIIPEFKIGLCDKHANELLTAAIIVKMSAKSFVTATPGNK